MWGVQVHAPAGGHRRRELADAGAPVVGLHLEVAVAVGERRASEVGRHAAEGVGVGEQLHLHGSGASDREHATARGTRDRRERDRGAAVATAPSSTAERRCVDQHGQAGCGEEQLAQPVVEVGRARDREHRQREGLQQHEHQPTTGGRRRPAPPAEPSDGSTAPSRAEQQQQGGQLDER